MQRSFTRTRRAIAAIATFSALAGCTPAPGTDVSPDMLRALAAAPPARPGADVTPDMLRAPTANSPAPAARATASRAVATTAAPPRAPAAPITSDRLTVTAPPSVGGVWRIVAPHSVRLSMADGMTYGAVRTNLCRFVQRGTVVSGHCLADRLTPVTGRYTGNEVRVQFGPGVFSGVVSGQNRMTGGLRMGLFGVGLSGAVPIAGDRLTASPGTPSPPRIDTEMRAMLASLTAEPPKPASAGVLIEADLRGLGALEALSYIDTVPLYHRAQPLNENLFVFQADFAGGTRLCGISKTPDGTIKRFMCG